MTNVKIIVFMIVILGSIAKTYSQKNWQLAKDKEGIKVFVNKVSYSDYYVFKAIMTVRASKLEIVKVLKDVNNYPKWFAFTASSKLINQSTNEQYFLLETDYPWPYSNECMNYRMNFSKIEGNNQEITIIGTNKNTECKFTLKRANGYILLEPDNGNTKITYYFHCEPSQNIPSWLINPRINEMPFQTFKTLRSLLKENY
jgi:hypothetical protein